MGAYIISENLIKLITSKKTIYKKHESAFDDREIKVVVPETV
jgi:hypothetical protein